MIMNARQREAAELWRRGEREKKQAEESRYRARYLQKWLRDQGDTKVPAAESKLKEIRKLADELSKILEDNACDVTPRENTR
jgi:hypothetical protein